ncbi:MAG: MFS transporter [Fimbriimonadales bacterium]|nr:MFS transporter [Fimbriimonadales bacterium]
MQARNPPPSIDVKSLSAFWALVVMAGFAELGYVTLNISAMPVYLREVVGLGEATITAVGSVFLLTEAIFRAPMGMLSDQIGRRRLIVLGPLLTVFTSLGTLVAHHPLHFILLRAIDGLGAAMLWPAVYAAIGDSVAPQRRAWAMSFLNMTYMSGIALGPLAGGLANDLTGAKQASFYLTACLFAAATFIAWRFYPKDGRPRRTNPDAPVEKISPRALLNALRIAPGHMLLAFVVFFGVGLIMLLVKLYAMDEFGVSETLFGVGLVVPALAIAGLSLPLGRLADRLGRPRSIRWGLSLAAVVLWSVVAPSQPPIAWVLIAAGLGAISFVLTFAAWMAELSEIDPARRGVILGAAGTAQGVGSILGALLGGFLYEHVPLTLGEAQIPAHRTPFIGCALMLSLGAILSWFVLKSDQRREG